MVEVKRDRRIQRHRRETARKRKGKKILERDNHTCQYCGFPAETIDHVTPVAHLMHLSARETNDDNNLVAACYECNHWKANRTVAEFYQTEYWQALLRLGIVKPGFPKVD